MTATRSRSTGQTPSATRLLVGAVRPGHSYELRFPTFTEQPGASRAGVLRVDHAAQAGAGRCQVVLGLGQLALHPVLPLPQLGGLSGQFLVLAGQFLDSCRQVGRADLVLRPLIVDRADGTVRLSTRYAWASIARVMCLYRAS